MNYVLKKTWTKYLKPYYQIKNLIIILIFSKWEVQLVQWWTIYNMVRSFSMLLIIHVQFWFNLKWYLVIIFSYDSILNWSHMVTIIDTNSTDCINMIKDHPFEQNIKHPIIILSYSTWSHVKLCPVVAAILDF